MTGPVQVLVVGLADQAELDGHVLAELGRLREAGIVRLVDLLLVRRDADGGFQTLPPPPGTDRRLGRVASALLAEPEAEPAADSAAEDDDAEDAVGDDESAVEDAAELWSLADVVPPGTSAVVALIEHTWAGPLVQAIRAAGGRALDDAWLPPSDVERLDRLAADVWED